MQGHTNIGFFVIFEKRGVFFNFLWWNAINPEPQKLLLDLIKEVVVNYEIDGIQGDDRLPAMPSEGGYDDFTKKLYFDDFGNQPPLNSKDENWLKWRADKLSEFGNQLNLTMNPGQGLEGAGGMMDV